MLRANSRPMKRIIFVVETPQAGSDQPITLGWDPASNPEGGESVPTGQVQVWEVPLNDHLGPSLCRRRSLLWLSSRLPRRNAEPVVRCSGVPQPYVALELTQSVAPPQVCHCCKGEGEESSSSRSEKICVGVKIGLMVSLVCGTRVCIR